MCMRRLRIRGVGFEFVLFMFRDSGDIFFLFYVDIGFFFFGW